MNSQISKIASLVLFILALSFFPIAYCFINRLELTDFEIYRHAGEAFKAGDNIYAGAYGTTLGGERISLSYFYPPFLAWLLSYGLQSLYLKEIWVGASLASLFASIALLFKLHWEKLEWQGLRTFSVLSLGVTLWPPIIDGLSWGQVNTILLLPLTISYWALIKRYQAACGVALGVAVAIKATPLLFLFPCLVFKQYRIVAFSIVSALLLNLPACFGPTGFGIVADFFSMTMGVAAGKVTVDPYYDYSIRQVLGSLIDLDSAGTAAAMLLLVILVAYGWSVLRSTAEQHKGLVVSWLKTLPVMVITAPMIWFHHLTWLAIVFVESAIFFMQRGAWKKLALLGAAYLVLGISLYLHVIVRHHLGFGEGLVKAFVPTLVLLLVFQLNSVVENNNCDQQY